MMFINKEKEREKKRYAWAWACVHGRGRRKAEQKSLSFACHVDITFTRRAAARPDREATSSFSLLACFFFFHIWPPPPDVAHAFRRFLDPRRNDRATRRIQAESMRRSFSTHTGKREVCLFEHAREAITFRTLYTRRRTTSHPRQQYTTQ